MVDATAYRSNIFWFVSQDASCLLKTKLLLILQRTHARYAAKTPAEVGSSNEETSRYLAVVFTSYGAKYILWRRPI